MPFDLCMALPQARLVSMQAVDFCMGSAPCYIAVYIRCKLKRITFAKAAVLTRPSSCLQTNKVAVHPEFPKLLKYISIIAPVSARPLLDMLPLLNSAGLLDS